MNRTKIQAIIDLLKDKIKNIDDGFEFKMIKEYINGTRSTYKDLLKKAIEIQNNDDFD